MDQYLNNRQNEILWKLLANPTDSGHLYTHNLQQLVGEFPQSGLLHAMLLRSDGAQGNTRAAAYLNPKTLYTIVNAPEILAEVNAERIIQPVNYTAAEVSEAMEIEEVSNITTETIIEEAHQAEIETVTVVQDEPVSEVITEEEVQEHQPIVVEENQELENIATNIREDEIVTESPVFELVEPPRGIEDEIYDEIVGIEDISFTQITKPVVAEIVTDEVSNVIADELPQEHHVIEPEANLPKDRVLDMTDEAEKLIVGNIAATDYFVFDKAFNDRKQSEAEESVPIVEVESEPVAAQITPETQEVAKYNDDTMPYTFMWWLNKTRKEHAGIYQPFKLDTTQAIKQHDADELQQQYYENIFHLKSVEELESGTPQQPVEFDLKTKEDRIIKRFIVEEPHISAPSSDKLDTENKAKKSAEDADEFVTETLARIYTDQMLYHKAINTYKKLMLKFPEKSRYFADHIEQLERKIN